MAQAQSGKIKASGTGTTTLPPGMTQEEADRLVAEADAAQAAAEQKGTN